MKHGGLLLACTFVLFAGCDGDGPFRTPWHAETLASGSTVKVTSFNLVWGAEHDEHVIGQDCFAIEYVSAYPDADDKRRDAEVAEVFELARPASEQWGFREATVAAAPALEYRGLRDLYWFRRQPDGHWSSRIIIKNGEWIRNALTDGGS